MRITIQIAPSVYWDGAVARHTPGTPKQASHLGQLGSASARAGDGTGVTWANRAVVSEASPEIWPRRMNESFNNDERVQPMPGLESAPRSGIQVIARAASLLRAIADHPGGMSLSEAAQAVRLPRSTVHRLVTALEAEDFLRTGPNGGRARLGQGLLRLASAQRPDLRLELRPYLERLSAEVGETVDLSILDGDAVLFIDQVSGAQRLRAVSSVGTLFSSWSTANGKALLAALPRDTVRALLPRSLRPQTSQTITNWPEFERELDLVGDAGVAFDREEHTDGISAVGVALPAIAGIAAAITVPMPTVRFKSREDEVTAALLKMREAVVAALG